MNNPTERHKGKLCNSEGARTMWIPAFAWIATRRIGYFQLEEWCGSVRVLGEQRSPCRIH